jgi:hypothetical protein
MSGHPSQDAGSRIALQLGHGNAICYSGYRQGQSPHDGIFPGYAEISEDLDILAKKLEVSQAL